MSRRWVADLAGVREVGLSGSADLGFWRARLAVEGLEPEPVGAAAMLVLVAADMAFMGMAFREFTVAVKVRSPRPDLGEAVFLEQAFNSRRSFAWCERHLFHAPYGHACIELDVGRPSHMQLATAAGSRLRAAQGPGALGESVEEGWEGLVLLPHKPRGTLRDPWCFRGALSGAGLRAPFRVEDRFELDPSPADPVMGALADSGFEPLEWRVRTTARHRKSATQRLGLMTDSG